MSYNEGMFLLSGAIFAVAAGFMVFTWGARVGGAAAVRGIACGHKYWVNRLEVERLKQRLEAANE